MLGYKGFGQWKQGSWGGMFTMHILKETLLQQRGHHPHLMELLEVIIGLEEMDIQEVFS